MQDDPNGFGPVGLDPLAPDPEKEAELRAIVERFCDLAEEVREQLLGHDRDAHCLCGKGWIWKNRTWPHPTNYWSYDLAAVEWIEAAVRAELNRRGRRRYTRLRRIVTALRDASYRLNEGIEAARKAEPWGPW